MKANPIRKVTSHTSWSTDMQGRTRYSRKWVATCPVCGETQAAKASLDSITWQTTRKQAKDALHRHMLERHHN